MGGVTDTLFGGGREAAAADMSKGIAEAQRLQREYADKAASYYQPYYQAGTGAIPQYQQAIGQMSDPNAYYNKVMSSYQMSPAAQFNMQQGIQAGTNAASAGGMNMSGAQREALAKYAQGITSQDQQQYLQNIMGINQGYLGGLQGLMGQGFNAGAGTAGIYGHAGDIQSQLAEQAAQAQAQADMARSSKWGNMIGFGNYMLGQGNPFGNWGPLGGGGGGFGNMGFGSGDQGKTGMASVAQWLPMMFGG